jgi:lipoprotein-anchoring transpeptidase ErfK/SrfK
VRTRVKLSAAAPRPGKPGGRRAALIVLALIVAGGVWMIFSHRSRVARPAPQNSLATSTNTTARPEPRAEKPATPVTLTPTNPPPLRSQISTVVVTRPILAVTNPPVAPRDSTAATNGLLEAQIALDRLGISAGSIDGVLGSQSRAAVRAFQAREGLPATGELDPGTRARLTNAPAPLTSYVVAEADITRLLTIPSTWLGKSSLPRLDFESVMEVVAEKHHAHPSLLRKLNPGINWSNVAPGTVLTVPATERVPATTKAAYLRVNLSQRTLQAYDMENRLLAHFPCSIAARVDKRPVGELRVAVLAPNPNYTFDPEVFPESAEARELGRKLIQPPGPNNPVGAAWIGLDRPGYGIHGTPKPEDVGRTESHGCFRLANWNAEYLLQLVSVGTVVRVEP